MAIGQGVLSASVLDVAELDRLGGRIEDRERRRSTEHAEQLVDVLAIHRVHGAAGMELSTHAYVALLMECSEHRARMMLADAQVLERLGALAAMCTGLLTVEQARVVVDVLGVLNDGLGASLWERLADRLRTDRQQSVVRPPARLRELLQRWVIAADPEGYAARRRHSADADADVELWKRDDGLADLVARSLSAADARACLDRIERLATVTCEDDQRSAGQRRQQAFVALLLGRETLPFDGAAAAGAQVFVHVPVATATGHTTQPAELVGHGPIDHEALHALLTADPTLHRVWVDEQGVPVAVDEQTWRPGHDPADLERALTELGRGQPPDRRHPVHQEDHPPPRPQPASALTRPQLADPGSYVPPQRLKKLLRARAPRCEWPGCGARACRAVAAGCDLDHDLAWPFGPTCACNLGPLCRRHHRIKQLGWQKTRLSNGAVRWASPSGRMWLSPAQHPPLAPARRRVAPGVWTLAA